MTSSTDRPDGLETAEPRSVQQLRQAGAFACIFASHAAACFPEHYFWGLPFEWTDFAIVGFDFLFAAGFYYVVHTFWYGYSGCIAIRRSKPRALLLSQIAGFAVMGVILAAWMCIVPQLRDVKPGYVGNVLVLGAMVFIGYKILMAINRRMLKPG